MWQWASMIFCGWVAMSAPSESAARLLGARLPFLAGVEALRRHQRRLVQQPRAVARVELHDLERELGSRRVERKLGGRVQRAAAGDVHLEPVRAERRDVLEQDDPLGALDPRALQPLAREHLPLLARDLAVAVAERGVADRLAVHQREHRGRGPRDGLLDELAPLVPGDDEIVLGADVLQQLGDRAHEADVLLVEVGVEHHGRVDPRLGAPPRCYGGLAVQHQHPAQTVQVFSWNAFSRHAVSAESSTSSGWNGLTPSISRFSGNPYSAPDANRQAETGAPPPHEASNWFFFPPWPRDTPSPTFGNPRLPDAMSTPGPYGIRWVLNPLRRMRVVVRRF